MISQLGPDVEAQPKAFCHNSVLHVWARAGDTRKIRHWFGIALDVGVNIPVTSLSKVIAALVKSGELGECEHWLVRMVGLD